MKGLLAQINNPVLPPLIGGGPNPSTAQGGAALGKIVSNLVGAIFMFGFLVAFLYLLFGAIHWISSGGDKANLENARNTITHAIIGLVIVGATYALTALLASFFGLELGALPIPTIPSQ